MNYLYKSPGGFIVTALALLYVLQSSNTVNNILITPGYYSHIP